MEKLIALTYLQLTAEWRQAFFINIGLNQLTYLDYFKIHNVQWIFTEMKFSYSYTRQYVKIKSYD